MTLAVPKMFTIADGAMQVAAVEILVDVTSEMHKLQTYMRDNIETIKTVALVVL